MRRKKPRPCKECPFRRTSLPGYLGNSDPTVFIATTQADVPMSCHMSIDYEASDWREQIEHGDAEYCEGALIFFANQAKLSRDPNRPQADPDHDKVFTWPHEFLEYHTREANDE